MKKVSTITNKDRIRLLARKIGQVNRRAFMFELGLIEERYKYITDVRDIRVQELFSGIDADFVNNASDEEYEEVERAAFDMAPQFE